MSSADTENIETIPRRCDMSSADTENIEGRASRYTVTDGAAFPVFAIDNKLVSRQQSFSRSTMSWENRNRRSDDILPVVKGDILPCTEMGVKILLRGTETFRYKRDVNRAVACEEKRECTNGYREDSSQEARTSLTHAVAGESGMLPSCSSMIRNVEKETGGCETNLEKCDETLVPKKRRTTDGLLKQEKGFLSQFSRQEVVLSSTAPHMHVFEQYVNVFKTWWKEKRSSDDERSASTFRFCGQKGKAIAEALSNLLQCRYYKVNLPVLRSVQTTDATKRRFYFACEPVSSPFSLMYIEKGEAIMKWTRKPSSQEISKLALFSHGRQDLYAYFNDSKQKTPVSFFVNMFMNTPHLSFLYVEVNDKVVSLMTYLCYRSVQGVLVVDIQTTQSDNQTAMQLTGLKRLSKGMGDQMFLMGLVNIVKWNGGGLVYAVCVKKGNSGKVWKSHPMQTSNEGNFIWLQLCMSSHADLNLEPLTYNVDS
jgi:hypothetical protein